MGCLIGHCHVSFLGQGHYWNEYNTYQMSCSVRCVYKKLLVTVSVVIAESLPSVPYWDRDAYWNEYNTYQMGCSVRCVHKKLLVTVSLGIAGCPLLKQGHLFE